MRGFRGQIQGLKLDGKFTATLDAGIRTQIRQAARRWIEAVILRVPQWTGQAVGSLKFADGANGFLSRYLNVAIPITAEHSKPSKNAETGQGFALYQFPIDRHVYKFAFTQTLPYFLHNDFFSRTDAGAKGQQIQAPWHALLLGQLAFEEYLRTEGLAKLPKIRDALIKTRSSFG